MKGKWGIAALVVLAMAGCGVQEIQDPILKKLSRDFPRIDGSTTTLVVTRALAAEVWGLDWEWTEPKPDALQRTIVPVEGSPEEASGAFMALKHNTTHQAYVNVITGDSDLGLLARRPSPDEAALAQESGVILEVVPLAMDAFVFLAHKENPLSNLTLDEIRGVYTGALTTWDQLGVTFTGRPLLQKITPYQRERNSGSQELMEELILPHDRIIQTPQLIVTTMLGPFNAIGGDLWGEDGNTLGLGYTVYFYFTAIFPHSRVKMVPINGISPTFQTIQEGSYPLTAPVFAVIRRDLPLGHRGRVARDWLLSVPGQRLLEKTGYVSLEN